MMLLLVILTSGRATAQMEYPQPVRRLFFETQLPAEPLKFDAPTTSTYLCQVFVNPRAVTVTEPRAGVNEKTGVLVFLHGIGVGPDCETAVTPSGDPAWPDDKNLIIASVHYRNLAFIRPFDYGKYQTVDVLRGLGTVLEAYPQVDRRRIYLWGGSGGGLVGLQVLRAAPHLWAEAQIHSPITRITTHEDKQGEYDRDPGSGWNGNMSFPVAQNQLSDEEWTRYQAERTLRGPQHAARYDGLLGTNEEPLFPIVMMHGTGDQLVDYQHFLDYRAALVEFAKGEQEESISPKEWRLRNWRFIAIEGGLHSYGNAVAPDENTKNKATAKYTPNAFTISKSEAPDLFVEYTFPPASGWTFRVTGDLKNAEIESVQAGEE